VQRPLANKVIRELRHAHELQEQGKHLEAAAIFEQLARKAQLRILPQFPQLLLQAGKSNIQGGDHATGVDQIKTALGVLVEFGRSERVAHLQPGLRALFIEYGLEPSWQDIHNFLQDVGIGSQTRPLQGLRLPSKCPYCGANLVPEELDDISSEAAVCGYCGSNVQASERNP
jgi:hypothetical protein